ncbi:MULTISPECIES: 3-deoxy-7-phosphoheptulonate synthase [Peptoniphilaceae]|uniref:Phospho-2-dehydro-3-deoxyheptonate aldolase n=1 Tax=Anaerococcus octavius TaxID=54007 RepID=A0A380WV69_9FIRM|nr:MULTISPECIES: 3-deoxy-7-phosphoheptulonate synthase [Peptoniphilaceae]MBS5775967.1 3-deoxy-7-phosphoheptulonate synthase [Finegoldia magna]MBS6611287.1 3-deoxy-7-phosphoheptulonate synthase [Peptoniphilus harei]MDU1043981.1 3-deoxy-7-phosphoheptulonate synthase [Peptoniphilus rhinitidis]SUU92729.1 Phospho-2-dehydro-3-deoxyheptonate aldolase [Anaerococcus octavius]
MQYILKEKEDFEACVRYLKKENILYQDYDIKDYYIINVFDNALCPTIENEEEAFLNTNDISIENGYLVTKAYKEKTTVEVKGIRIGDEEPVVISGPCSVESEEVVRRIATEIKKIGVDILRGGAFKPRTSPYDFQGLGKGGIDILYKIGKEFNMPIVTEIMDIRDLDYMIDKVDIFQVGSRNMYNYSMLKELGKIDKPILLKRGLSATIKEFLLSAEYIMLGGNEKIILCERGVRTYEKCTRNTMDIAAIPLLKKMTHLPIIADPSHATGKRELIESMSRASISAGADGLIIESHSNPENAWSDGMQSINMYNLSEIIQYLKVQNKKR